MTDKIFSRADLEASELKTQKVFCPELGGSVILRELTAGQISDIRSNADLGADIPFQLSLMIVDEEGNLLFSDKQGIALLRHKLKASAAMRLIAEANKLNKETEEAVDEVVKNLEADPIAVSESASQ